MNTTEKHPLQPFLPADAELLMLGSFPPDRKRWSMEFFYPNFINDMWRIIGYVFFGDKGHFVIPDRKAFDRRKIEEFLTERKIAMYDTAEEVLRLKDNASDKFLEIVRPTDMAAVLGRIPACRAIVTTGQKAAETFCMQTGSSEPKTGECTEFEFLGRSMRHYRMPSSSRAYPMSVERKAEVYERMFRAEGILH